MGAERSLHEVTVFQRLLASLRPFRLDDPEPSEDVSRDGDSGSGPSGDRPTPMLPREGSVFSERYTLVSLIGSGGAAAVFRGRDEVLGQEVAIKVLHPDGMATPDGGRSPEGDLRAEAITAMRLSHPLITRVFTYDRHTPWEYLVMELVPGQNLHVYRRSLPGRRLPFEEVVRIGADVLEALAYAHDQGVVHNDIKPRNILMDSRGSLKVCDFGLAELVHGRRNSPHAVAGTAAYMSPERIHGAPGDPRSDLYSLGATLFTLAAGRTPFGSKITEAFRGHLQQPMPTDPYVPGALDAVLRRAMEKEPSRRFPDAMAMRAALLQSLSRSTLPSSDPRVASDPASASAEQAPTMKAVPASPEVEAPKVRRRAAPPDMAKISARRVTERGETWEVAPFYVERTPVTNAQYAEFVRATGAMPPTSWPGTQPPKDRLDHPVVGVTLEQARAYARWKGRRLPTSVEWVAVVRGEDGRKFPWGNVCNRDACQCPLLRAGATAPVHAHPLGANPEGVVDLLGNVWEWTELDDRMPPDEPGYHFVYGGSYRHACQADQGILPRTTVAAGHAYNYLGFRCAMDVEEA